MKRKYLLPAAIALMASTSSYCFAATASEGAALYTMKCLSCHGPLETSNKVGATAGMIQNAIYYNYGGMSFLSNLTVADIQGIAAALYMYIPSLPPIPPSPPAPTPPDPQWDGAALYGSYCSSCHNPLASSTKAGATESDIQAAISSNTGGMGYFSTLTSAQVSAIATALAGDGSPAPAPTPTPGGVALYTANCSSCHGQIASSSVMGATVSGIESAINSNKGGMSRLSSLAAADLQAIADALANLSGTPAGHEGGDD